MNHDFRVAAVMRQMPGAAVFLDVPLGQALNRARNIPWRADFRQIRKRERCMVGHDMVFPVKCNLLLLATVPYLWIKLFTVY